MALVLKDRVKGWTDSYGEDNFVIFATTNGYQSFSVIGNGNQTYYTVFDPTNYDWEVGIGTYTAATTTLSRDTILSSSNNNLIVSFLPGTKELFVGYPAEKAVTLDTPQTITDKTLVNATVTSGTINNTTIGATTPASGAFTTLVASGASLTSVNAGVALLTSATVTTLDATSVSIASANVGNLQGVGASIGSINAGVAVVTNLTATGASVASINASVALFTDATTTTLNATGASIASANIGNLQFTAASIASINAGIAVITNLTATSASIASMNAGVALLTNATVTTFNATGASIASANIGNLQFTAASIASINAGVAVITNLTATGASIASANVGNAVITAATVTGASIASANLGTAVITTGTVTNLTATSASVASANAAVALVTTGTVTNLTSTGASIASANLGTAVITGLTATGASIASANIGNAYITTLSFTNASITSANIGTAVITTLTATGASIASVNAGVAVLAAGTAALPSLTTTGDTNTGIYFPAADQVAVTTGGTVAAAFNSNGLFFRNRIINGDMRIDQRNAGASVNNAAAVNTYVIDRFALYGTSASKISGQQSTTVPTDYTNSFLITSLAATSPSAGDAYGFRQVIEGTNVSDLNWGSASAKTITISFWVRSSITGTYSLALFNADAPNRSYIATYAINSANTFEYKTVTIAGDTSGTWLKTTGQGIQVWWDLGSGTNFNDTAGSWIGSLKVRTSGSVNFVGTNGATFYITGVQLETGSVATPFERRPYGTELMLCQRYCQKLAGDTTYTVVADGWQSSTTSGVFTYSFGNPMRASPTLTTGTVGDFYARNGSITSNLSTLTLDAGLNSTKETISFNATWAGAGGGNGYGAQLVSGLNAPKVILSAEL